MKIVVIGGTGLIGSKVVEILKQHGHEVVAASRFAARPSWSMFRILHRWMGRPR